MSNYIIHKDKVKGQRFGKLEVVKFSHKNKWGAKVYKCICDCGEYARVNISHLRSGTTNSCGCLRSESKKGIPLSHGKSLSRIYYIWDNMIQRCTNKNNKHYHNYGGRGIKVSDAWINSFEDFYKDVSSDYYLHKEKYGKDNTTINRIDNNGNYEPGNVNWATRTTQSAYQRTPSSNTSGFKGVNYRKDRKKWRAFISKEGKTYNLGNFDKKEDAKLARLRAEKELYGELLPR